MFLGFVGWTEERGTFNSNTYTDYSFSLIDLFLSFSLAIHDLQNISMIFTDSLEFLGTFK